MEKLVPYVENILYDTIIPNMLVTKEEVETFQNEPIEYIRMQIDDYTIATKDSLSDLLRCLTDGGDDDEEDVSTLEDRSKPQPKVDYLKKFLEFSIKNLNEYAAKL